MVFNHHALRFTCVKTQMQKRIAGRWSQNNCYDDGNFFLNYTSSKALASIICYFESFYEWEMRKYAVTDPLCDELTGHRRIPLTNASDAELWCFLWYALEQTVE